LNVAQAYTSSLQYHLFNTSSTHHHFSTITIFIMDITPGTVLRDSRSLSVETAQYGAVEISAEAEFLQLEAAMKAARAKADQARLQKQRTAAAREDAFQAERELRQAAVRDSVTEHHYEGMRKAVKLDKSGHLFIDLKRVAAGEFEAAPNAAIFVGAMVLRELAGNGNDFLMKLAGNVLADPVEITAASGLQISQRYDSPKQVPNSPSPAGKARLLVPKSPEVPTSTSPGFSFRNADESMGLEIGSIETGGLLGSQTHDYDVDAGKTGQFAVETTADTPETFVEIEGQEQEEAEAAAAAAEIEQMNHGEVARTGGGPEIADTPNQNNFATSYYYYDDGGTPAEETLDTISSVEYGTDEDEDAPAPNAHVFKQEPSVLVDTSIAINAIAALVKQKRHSTETATSSHSYDPDTASPLTIFRRATQQPEQEEDSDMSRSQTPQPAKPAPKKKPAKPTPTAVVKKTPVKRKRQDSEASTLAAAGETGDLPTPAKKGKTTKPKDDNGGKSPIASFLITPSFPSPAVH
jgi:hypothetical protein